MNWEISTVTRFRILCLPVCYVGIQKLKYRVKYYCFSYSETWYLILREGHRLRVFSNRVLIKILVPKSQQVRADWKKVHNEE